MWYHSKVFNGSQTGKKIGFPTINLDPTIITDDIKTGIYSAQVKYQNKIYLGALYFGPRLVKNETNNILEIHILNFDQIIYGEEIEFVIGKYIRGVINFKTFKELKNQIEQDIAGIKQLK